MAGRVFFSMSMSLDGFIVPESMEWLRATPEVREFEGVTAGRVALTPVRAEPTARVTHLTYAVRKR